MTLGIVKINSCMTSKLPTSRKSWFVIIESVADKVLLYIVNKHQCNMFTMCSFFFFLLLLVLIIQCIVNIYRIGNRKLNSKLPIVIFQINSISLIESENLGKPQLYTFLSNQNDGSRQSEIPSNHMETHTQNPFNEEPQVRNLTNCQAGGQGCARFPQFLQSLSERQILWSLCSVDFHTLTLQLPIQTLHSVAPELQVL